MEIQEVYDALIEVFFEHLEEGSLPEYLKSIQPTPQMRVDDLGIDSMSKVGLVASLMDKTDCYLPDSLFLNNPTFWEIAERAQKEMIL